MIKLFFSLCVSVCLSALSQLNSLSYVKIGVDIAFENISAEFRGQGHRSKVKVTILKKKIFLHFL